MLKVKHLDVYSIKNNPPRLFFLIVLTILLFQYSSITNLWWMFDDAQHLKLVLLTDLRVFTHPAAEVGYIPANFTPWLFLNYWIDFKLFGLDPRGAYYHQLFSLLFTVICTFWLLKKIVNPWIAGGAVLYFFCTPVAHTVIHILCTRHYLEGLGYVSVGFAFLLKYREFERRSYLFLSMLFLFISFINKEVYIAVLGIIFCVTFFDFVEYKQWGKFKPFIACLVISILYVCYRGYALGWENLVSGYGSNDNHRGFIEVYFYIREIISFNKLAPLAIFSLILFITYALFAIKEGTNCYRIFKFSAYIASFVICIFVPVYKVMPTANVNHNYVFLATFMLIFGSSFLLSELAKKIASRNAAFIAVILFAGMVFHQHLKVIPKATLNIQNKSEDLFKRFRVEGEYLLYSSDSPTHKLLNPVGAPWHHLGLLDLRRIYLQRSDGPSVCYQFCDCQEAEFIYGYKFGELARVDTSGSKCNQD